MVSLRVDGPDLVVELGVWEKVAALRGNLRVPLAAVRAVEVLDRPTAAVRGMRAPGYDLPGHARIGTWRRRGGRRTFAAAYSRSPGLRVELHGQRYSDIVVSVDDPVAAAREVRPG